MTSASVTSRLGASVELILADNYRSVLAAERMLAALWSTLLGVSPIGRGDRFFELGGHSLSVMRLLSRIRQRFGVELGAQTVFAFPTLAAQARVVAAAWRGAESTLPPLAPLGNAARQGLPACP